MRATRIACLGVAAMLLVAGALVWAGCGEETASPEGTGAVSGLQPFVAYATVGPGTEATITMVGDIEQMRDGKASYTVEASDPRVSGTNEVVYNFDTAADGSSSGWGTSIVTNSNGTWVCDSWSGAQDAKTGHTFTFCMGKGTGDYAGLIACWQWFWPLDTRSFTAKLPLIAVSGWIQKDK